MTSLLSPVLEEERRDADDGGKMKDDKFTVTRASRPCPNRPVLNHEGHEEHEVKLDLFFVIFVQFVV